MPRPVALFLPSLGGGGAERSMIDVARGLAESGLEVDLVVAHGGGPYRDRVPAGVRVEDLGVQRVSRSLPALVRYLRRRRPVALLSAMAHANIAAVAARALARVRCRVVVSERVALSALLPDARWRFRVTAALRGLFYRRADAIVAVSEGVADDLVATCGIRRERIRVIFNPVVTPELLARAREPLDHPWFEAGSPPVVLAVGRLNRQKNFAGLIEAWALVRRERECRLLILGEGPERASLEGLAERLGLRAEVGLPGYTPNPYPFMARAAVFVLSSSWEGLPGALIEAMAIGCPVVSTDCPAGPREILDGGRLAPLVPVADPVALARAIDSVLGEPPPVEPLVRRAQDFRMDRVVPRYREVLGTGDGGGRR